MVRKILGIGMKYSFFNKLLNLFTIKITCSCSYVPGHDFGFSCSFKTKYLYYPMELHFTLFITRLKFNKEHPQENVAFTYFFWTEMSRSTVLIDPEIVLISIIFRVSLFNNIQLCNKNLGKMV